MTFRYGKTNSARQVEHFEFTPTTEDVEYALADILLNEFGVGGYNADCEKRNKMHKAVIDFCNDYNLWEQLEKDYYDDLYDWFSDEALKEC